MNFGERLTAFVRATVTEDGGVLRKSLRAAFDQLCRCVEGASVRGIHHHLEEMWHVAHALNSPHHEVVQDAFVLEPGFYVGGAGLTAEMQVVIGLLCVVLQRQDPADLEFPPVHLLSRGPWTKRRVLCRVEDGEVQSVGP